MSSSGGAEKLLSPPWKIHTVLYIPNNGNVVLSISRYSDDERDFVCACLFVCLYRGWGGSKPLIVIYWIMWRNSGHVCQYIIILQSTKYDLIEHPWCAAPLLACVRTDCPSCSCSDPSQNNLALVKVTQFLAHAQSSRFWHINIKDRMWILTYPTC